MLRKYIQGGIFRLISVVLIFSIISNVTGQTDSTLCEDEETIQGESPEKEYFWGGYYNQTQMRGRGVSVPTSSGTDRPENQNSSNQRKLLPAPVIIDTTGNEDNAKIVSVDAENKVYKFSDKQKRILLLSGAVLLTGGLVAVVIKLAGKGGDDSAGKVEVIPGPPPLPQF